MTARSGKQARKLSEKHAVTSARSFVRRAIIASALSPVLLALDPSHALAQTAGSTIGEPIVNPVTGLGTVVLDLIRDPAGTPTAGNVAWVRTADGYTFLVKQVGEIVYNNDPVPLGFTVVGINTTTHVATLAFNGETDTVNTRLTNGQYDELFNDNGAPGITPPPIQFSNPNGVSNVIPGEGGNRGRDGALFVPPTRGGHGAPGPTVIVDNFQNVNTSVAKGIEVGSIGGLGGDGGDSYGSFWDGEDGGNGGVGGPVTVINNTNIAVLTSGADHHGIFAFSRSGQAGNGGGVYAAPSGGTGGHSSDGGNVTVDNRGFVQTNGLGANGIYALSVSGNGGNGGSSWGLVGSSGNGNYGGNGGVVSVTNSGTILTLGAESHGIVAQSVGGSGGNSGTSGALLVALNGSPDNGGNGGVVNVTNSGIIETRGNASRGIVAQSTGGGGGTGGSAGGLIALGGSGSNGGSANTVSVTNSGTIRTGTIDTTTGLALTGTESDGIFVQSVGGSGGSGSDAGGLVAIGGSGARAGNGGIVNVTNTGEISTVGDKARGIVAQSIGGGGGDGGNSGGMVSVGGSGDGGGFSQKVTVTNSGSISTRGEEASAIFVQSVGGGGGNGGSSGSVGAFAGVAVGGSGGGGGTGGDVDIVLQGANSGAASLVSTTGDRSTGVFAQSVGGGGGNGGGAVQASGGIEASASIAIGGSGGEGGDAGVVRLLPGTGGVSIVQTRGDDSTGIFLQSVGGGGGNGGYAIAMSFSGGVVGGASLSAAIGGDGEVGGDGGTVQVGQFNAQNQLVSSGFNGTIVTQGDRSSGFFAQSVGGGGGNGGLAVAGAASANATIGAGISLGIGGDGESGGNGGNVFVGTGGNISTSGAHSTGMVIQSVGGGGGNGGGSIAASVGVGGAAAASVSVGMGGKGDSGGAGGNVVAATTGGRVTTLGESSTGIVVQSVGGGGGNGGYTVAAGAAGAGTGAASVNVGLGGAGGVGGNAGNVTARLASEVATEGDNSSGIVVQSVGGGGGNGGFSVTAGAAGAGTGAGGVSVGLGGDGGTAGNGSAVVASSDGARIVTQGDRSSAFVAQSIGGGGGNGGFSVSGSVFGGGTGGAGVSVGLGGGGGGGGVAGTVGASVSSDIFTFGDQSTGILAQSVGGGGGNGGFNVSVVVGGAGTGAGAVGVGLGGTGGNGSNASQVTLTVDNDTVRTEGVGSSAVVAQSIGGGGGNGGFNVSAATSVAGTGTFAGAVGFGGSGGGGGNGDAVISTMNGNIATLGAQSNGFLAQSVGGGGGNGGMNISATLAVAGTGAGGASVGFGGAAGSGGNANTVTASFTGDVVTQGNSSAALIAQSLGGGGGNGGMTVSGTVSAAGTGSGGVSVGFGGTGGSGGNALRADLTVIGNVSTQGAESGGVLAQSLGGGGGNGGLNISGTANLAGTGGGSVAVGFGGSGGGGGTGGEADATVTGNVTTIGASSNAVTSQSIGGGGGNGGMNISGGLSVSSSAGGSIAVGFGGSGATGGRANAANATVTGNLTTAGENSHGLLVQSVGGGGGNGGMNISGGLSVAKGSAGTVSVGFGGAGGGGGQGGTVEGTLTGDVETIGDDSYGVILQSLGGGGGNGGMNISGGMTVTKGTSGTAAIGFGGAGGLGSIGDTVTGLVDGTVNTHGDRSTGVLAQSVGGGGGNGGLNVSGALTLTQGGSASAAIGVGGFGGGGGNSGTVTLERMGETTTRGANADGVVAQSIGGGGGNGGINISAGLAGTTSGSTSFAAALGLGGFGGDAGDAAAVVATVDGNVSATGVEIDEWREEDGLWRRYREGGSNGILAQSVGGGGGNGGLNISGGIALAPPSSGHSYALNLGVGGFGGDGGEAGTVDLTVNATTVLAMGDHKFAVAAQSIGGGGGNGGTNISGGVVMDGQITAGVGGFGGGGGEGRGVVAHTTSDLYVVGRHSVGFIAQSIGGGGGNGGINISGGLQGATNTTRPSLLFGLGGEGGPGNISGSVDASHSGNVFAQGANSIGVLAQSIAGGGGNGALNITGNAGLGRGYSAGIGIGGEGGLGADADLVTLVSDGFIFVDGREASYPDEPEDPADRSSLSFLERANGILAQSIGGGGGNGGLNVTGVLAPRGSPLSAGVGGSGSGGGNAGAVTVNRGLNVATQIFTRGNDANGLTAQSIGGGGGSAGMNFVVQSSLTNAGGAENKQANLVIGGSGGDPGNGNVVNVTHRGQIFTEGKTSDGILAQSVGGGGGNANINFGVGVNRSTSGFDIIIGGAPGDGGYGDTVNVDHLGDIVTRGRDSNAIMAQSVGGGGGDAEADDTAVTDRLQAPEIAIDVLSDPESSTNITLGRRGGTGGHGGDVNVISDGTLITEGDLSLGIFAQSVGNAGGTSSTTSVVHSKTNEVSVQLGLEGGDGGYSGAVDVTAAGYILTDGMDAHAIHAQSVGGGGGVGGSVTSKLLQGDNSMSVGLGGQGGIGGAAGAVDVTNDASILTRGEGAIGIFAQSIGGGGGEGGYAGITETAAYSAAANFIKQEIESGRAGADTSTRLSALVGGNGGEGGTGDTVTVNNTGSIITQGRLSHGINAVSIGGGGGDGGMVVSGNIGGGRNDKALTVNVGGNGNRGGSAEAVTVINEGFVATQGDEAVGIRAQSVGGGGGDGGLLANFAISALTGTSSSASLTVNVGGTGDTGGTGGDVTVTNRRDSEGSGGVVHTEGRAAHGIFAQSIGGGGGNGSSILSANFAGGADSTIVGVNIGGNGGVGGSSGTVRATNDAAIETLGDGSHGIFAQSIGGGGGNGGLVLAVNAAIGAKSSLNTPLAAIGGSGARGERAGDVHVVNSGSIVTQGKESHGILAQSIGGGGGNAGIGVGLTNQLGSTAVAGVLSAVFGGSRGEGGEGCSVTVEHSGDITVLGHNSAALIAESINGGGGHIALDFNGITSLPGGSSLPGEPIGIETDPVFVFRGGGSDTQTSNAGRVSITTTGTFGVAGNNSAGSNIQAIGGGGGTFDLTMSALDAAVAAADRARLEGALGGLNGIQNRGGDIESAHAGELVTEGANTPGVFMQSVGGGGGRANIDVTTESGTLGASTFTLGGTNGSDEAGGVVTHSQQGTIVTEGAASHGAMIQSVGGGGGVLSYRISSPSPLSLSVASSRPAIEGFLASVPSASAPVSLTLGSSGGTTLTGGTINLNLAGGTHTTGPNATGLILQSIGAGGGTASVLSASSLDVTLGGSNGATGNGGDLELTNEGVISTTGARSHGVVLQSIGGGGAAVFTDVATPTVTLSSSNVGNGGAISFTQAGDIVTEGTDTYGLLAQSIGGGGGFVDATFAGTAGGEGDGGAITLSIDGNVESLGARSTAVFAQSAGRNGGGDIQIDLTSDHHIIGSAEGVALKLDGGSNNLFTNRGSVMTMSGITGSAIIGSAGSDVIENHGVMMGNLALGGGTNALNNRASGTFYAGPSVSLGAATNWVTNRGVLSPGAENLAITTELAGSFRQLAGGRSEMELDFLTNALDNVNAAGRVELSGDVDVTLLNTQAIKSGVHLMPLFRGAAGVTTSDFYLYGQPSMVIRYELAYPNATTAALRYNVDFAAPGTEGNQIEIGHYINRFQDNGSSPALADTIRSLVAQISPAPYENMITQLGAEFYAEQLAYTLNSTQGFSRAMQNCGTSNMTHVDNDDRGCSWSRFDYSSSDRELAHAFPSTEQISRRFSQGVHFAGDDGWTFGVGLEYEHNDSHGFNRNWIGEARTLQLGLHGRHDLGGVSLGGTVAIGSTSQRVERRLQVAGPERTKGERRVGFATGVLDVSNTLQWGALRVTPSLNLGLSSLRGQQIREWGAPQDLLIESGRQTHVWAEPSLAFGYEKSFANRTYLNAFARMGLLHFLTADTAITRASFANGPAGADPMRVVSDLDRTHLLGEAGFEIVVPSRYTVSLSYSVEESDIRSSGQGTLRIVIPIGAK